MTLHLAPRIESKDLTLADLFKDFYSVPDFQREYVWEQQHVEKLLDDVFEQLYDENQKPLEGREYFVGSIVVCPDTNGTFQLIDGQQRLTTSYLILCAARDALKANGVEPPNTLVKQISDTSMDPRTGEDLFRHRVSLQYDDSCGVLDKIANAVVPVSAIQRTTESVRHILAAYEAIDEFIKARLDNDPSRIKAFLATFTLRVKLIRIVTPNVSNALKVFETINDRGVGLNAMDLLKNLLFMSTASDDYPKLKERWKILSNTLEGCREKPLRFLRYYIVSHHAIDYAKGLYEDDVYDWFVAHIKECKIDTEPLQFVDVLLTCARAYANFADNKDSRGTPNRYLQNIALVSRAARQHFILLLAGRHLPPDVFSELCRNVENLFFCYLITREPTKSFERNFARWSKELRSVGNAVGLKTFVDKYLKPDLQSRSKAFDFAFSQLAWGLIQQYRLRYILAKLTQFVEEKAWGNPARTQLDQYTHSSVHIEHILSQTPSPDLRAAFDKPSQYDAYTLLLGNLTLLERTINTSVSNGTFEVKKPGYRQSAFLLTKSLVELPTVGVNTQLNRAVEDLIQFETWNSEAIGKRHRMLGRLARKVWEIPDAV